MSEINWQGERMAQLRRLASDDKLTIAAISKEMGLGKATVLRKIHEKNLRPRRATRSLTASELEARKQAALTGPKIQSPERFRYIPVTSAEAAELDIGQVRARSTGMLTGNTLALLPASVLASTSAPIGPAPTCQYVLGKHLMCGAKSHRGRSWCLDHCKIVFVNFRCDEAVAPPSPASSPNPSQPHR